MQLRELGETGLTVSRACLGTAPFGTEIDERTARRMIHIALDAGINFIDTADVYGDGASESVIGKAVKGRRDTLVIATKVGRGRFRKYDGDDPRGLSRTAIRRALDSSLRRLGTDYVDIYYLHAPDHSVPIEESLEVLDEAFRAGKVREPASSNYSSWQVCEMIGIAERRNFRPARIGSSLYNILAPGIEKEYLPMAEHLRVSIVAYNALAGGFLVGDQRRDAPVQGSRFDGRHPLSSQYLPRYWHDTYFAAVEELNAAACQAGRSLISISLAWLLHHTPIDCVVVGAARPDQLQENLVAMQDGPLQSELLESCNRVRMGLECIIPDYIR